MTNFRKVLGACLAVFVLMGVQACNRDVAEPSNVSGKAQAEEIIYKEGTAEMPISETLSFDFSEEENQLKALNATVSATTGSTNKHAVTYANKIPVVCIVRSNQNDPVTYVNDVEIVKQTDGTYKFAKDRVRLAAGSTLAPGKRWFLMVVTQNVKINKNNGDLTVDANGNAETLSPSATRMMDIPSASSWIELPMFPNGQPKWSKDWAAARKAKRLKLYPQGVLCRATLRLDDAYKAKLGSDNVDLKITQLKVVSTALSFSGKFKFDAASLPPITETERRPTLKWEPTQTASTAREYRALDANTPEYQKVFNAPNGVLQVSGSGSSTTIFADSNNPARVNKATLPQGVQSIIFWAIPVEGVTNRHTTLIAERGESTLPNKVLAPSHTYIYGKKHTKDAGQGRAVYFDAVYYNPYTPLDYMAEYNLARNNPGEFRNGGLIPTQPSNKFATDHGVNSFAMVTQREVVTIKIPGADGRTYVNPDIDQWESVIPYQGDAAVNISSGGPVNNVSVNVALGTKKGVTKFFSRRVGNVVYALALSDFGGTQQKYRVAYRYSGVDNSDAPETAQPAFEFQRTLDFAKVRARQCPCHKDNPRFVIAGYAYPVRRSFQVEAIHLGAGFVGGVEDIAKEEFWSQATVNKEKRVLPLHTNAWRAYGNPTGIPEGIQTNYKLRDDFFKKNKINRFLYDHALNCYPGSWGASILSEVDGPTFYYLGDPRVAICKGDTGWALYDLRGTGKNEKLLQVARYSCRPFTKQER